MSNVKSITTILTLAMFSVCIFIGCQKDAKRTTSEKNTLSPNSIPKILNNASLGGLQLPNGTTTEILNNGATVKFNFPEGVFLVGKTSTGEIQMNNSVEYTCTGNCTSGCDVFYVNGSFACSSCDPNTITCTGKAKQSIEAVGSGFINLKKGITFIKNKKEASALFNGPDILFQIPEIKEAMKAFNLKIHGTENPDIANTKNYKEVAVNLFGCLVTYLVPKNSPRLDARSEEELIDAASWSCRCDAPAGSKGCTKDSGIGYKRCVSGDCTSCTMVVPE